MGTLVLGCDLGQWLKDYGSLTASVMLALITLAYVVILSRQSRDFVRTRLDLRGPVVVCHCDAALNSGSGASTLTAKVTVENFSPAPVLVSLRDLPPWRMLHEGDPAAKVVTVGRNGQPWPESFHIVFDLPDTIPDPYPFTVRFVVASLPAGVEDSYEWGGEVLGGGTRKRCESYVRSIGRAYPGAHRTKRWRRQQNHP